MNRIAPLSWLFALAVALTPAAAHPEGLGIALPAPVYAGHQAGYPYVVRRGTWSAAFGPSEVAFALGQGDQTRHRVRWRLVGASPVAPRAEQPMRALVSEAYGDVLRAGLQGYRDVRWPGAIPGVDLVWRSHPRTLEWLLEVQAASASRRTFEVEVAGVDGVVHESRRSLRLVAGKGVLLESGLSCHQPQRDGPSREVECGYVGVRQVGPATWRYTLEASGLDPEQPLIVDPSVFWSLPFGGSGSDRGMGLCVVADGFVVGGQTASSDMPHTPRADADQDAFVTLVSKDLDSLQTLYLGSSGTEVVSGVACSGDTLYLTGSTSVDDWPKQVGDTDLSGKDGFLALVTTAGGLQLAGVTYVGEPDDDEGIAVSVAPGGTSVVVAGTTGYSSSASTPTDIGVWSFSADLTKRNWYRRIQGDDADFVRDVVATAAGAHVVGRTKSSHFNQSGAVQGQHDPRPAATYIGYVLGVGPTTGENQVLHYSWVGGGGDDSAEALATDGTNLYVAGTTKSEDFLPLGPVFDKVMDANMAAGESEGFVAKLARRGSTPAGWDWEWRSALGGPGMRETVKAMAWFGADLVVTGYLSPNGNGYLDFPGLVDRTTPPAGDTDLFVARLAADGTTVSSRVIGGDGSDTPHAVRAGASGSRQPILVVGTTASSNFASTNVGIADAGTLGSYDPFLLATDVTPPKLSVVDSDGTSTTTDVDYTNGNGLHVSWTVEEPEDDQRRLEVWYAASLPDGGCSATSYPKATLDLPGVVVDSAPPYHYVPTTAPRQGAKLYAVVKVTNSTGLADLACSDGVVMGFPDGGAPGADASRPDAAATQDAGAPGPDAGPATLDAGVESIDAAALRPDAAVRPDDAGSEADAGAAADAGASRPVGALGWSCDCSSAAGGAWAWLACLPLAALRRRREGR